MNIQITVKNDGFAAPMSTAPVELVLQQGNITHNLEINGTSIYPHFWLGNGTEHTIRGRVWIPNEAEIRGTWNIFFRVTDAALSLREVPQYNILIVNQLPAAQLTGLNDLQRSITITSLPTPMPTESGVVL